MTPNSRTASIIARRRRRALLAGGAAALCALGLSVLGLIFWHESEDRSQAGRSQAASGGPIQPNPDFWSISVTVPAHDIPYTHSGLFVSNPTNRPVVLERVELVRADKSMSLVGALAATRRGTATISFPGFPPREVGGQIEAKLHPLDGYRVAPGEETQVFLGLDVDGEGRHVFRSLRLFYRYEGSRYQVLYPIGFALCTPVRPGQDCAPLTY